MSEKVSVIHTSFTKRITLFMVTSIILLLVCFCILSYILTRMNVESNAMKTMNNTGSVISGMLDDHMKSAASQLDIIAEDSRLKNFAAGLNAAGGRSDVSSLPDFSEITGLLDIICDRNSNIVSAWIISEQNGILAGNGGTVLFPEEYGLYDKHWYDNYYSGKIGGYTYICDYYDQSMLTEDTGIVPIIVPVKYEGNVYAFCGIEVRADSLFEIFSKYTFNDGSYPIVSSNGTIIYDPHTSDFYDKFDLEEIPLSNIVSQSSYLTETVDSYISDTSAFSENGNVVYYYQKTSSVSGLNIFVLFDSTEINGSIYKIFIQQVLILVCLCTLMMIFVVNMLHRESSPLHEIRDCTSEMADGNYNYRIKATVNNELGTVASNINKVSDTIRAKNTIISSYNTTDTLTGLNNRSTLYERMDDIINTREEGRSRFAVMFVDIDNFKWLNETLGHNYGDAVLSSFAAIIRDQLPPEVFIARFSGDEFVILKEFDTEYSEVQDLIENLHNRFNRPIEILNDKFYIKFSVGVSIYPDDDTTSDMLLRDAELALNRAKESGKDRVAFYTNTAKKQGGLGKAEIARNLNDALKNGELFLHYQPIVSAQNCDIHGFEVLLRWISPEFGVIPPAEFVNVAEESGDIIQIGTWIFESACRTLKQINEQLNPDIIMSINVSPVQLKRSDYIDHIKQVIDITQVNPKNIQLEITESTLVDFSDTKNNVINQIDEMGIAIALDDFGTGYSSLNYLKNFPIKCLKIDKSFIDEINNNQRDYAITDSIIDLVHNLGIHTVAEGIETVGQYTFLSEMQCDYIQGFLMSKPLKEADAIEFIKKYDELHKPDKRKMEENEKKLADERKQREEREHKEDNKNDTAPPTEDFIISK
ncbi:MAG: EAL domain-containing protein [Oscillospiraceae bacterium]|nr:EAL domain-containing protein [Oscillospiraceae bacterium]